MKLQILMLRKTNISEMVENNWEKLQFYWNQTCKNIKKFSEIKAVNSLDTTDLWDKKSKKEKEMKI